MDRGKTRFLIAAAPLLLLAGAADAPVLPIAEARWLAPAGVYESLTRRPAECLIQPKAKAARASVAIGRAAFGAPLLLGGQAARAGLSCASCHRSGRGNPHFSFPGLSGAPGTADVTSSLMSSHRGDRVTNPKPIPDLAVDPPKVSHDRQSRALETFIRGLIVEEFDGPEPPAAVLRGLADYVRAMKPEACRGAGPVTLASALAEVDDALAAAQNAARGGDGESAGLLIGAARSALGRIDERFALAGLERGRALLRRADAELRPAARMSAADAGRAISAWQRRWPARLQGLRRQESRSLFSPAVLGRLLKKSQRRS